MSNIHSTAARASAASNRLLVALERELGVKATIRVSSGLEIALAIFKKGQKLYFCSFDAFVYEGVSFTISFKNVGETRFAVSANYCTSPDFQESKNGFDITRVINYITNVTETEQQKKIRQIEEAKVLNDRSIIAENIESKIPRSFRPKFSEPRVQVITLAADQYLFTVAANEATLLKVAALLTTVAKEG